MTDQSPSVSSVAEIATPNASRYLQQLCKHFLHRVPASFDTATGQIEFPSGACHLHAGDGSLKLSLTSPDPRRMTELQDVVTRHLLRFAFREQMQIDWRAA